MECSCGSQTVFVSAVALLVSMSHADRPVRCLVFLMLAVATAQLLSGELVKKDQHTKIFCSEQLQENTTVAAVSCEATCTEVRTGPALAAAARCQ